MVKNRRLVTIKKAVEVVGASDSFLRDLIAEGVLTKYQIKSAIFISLAEFEEIATPVKKQKIEV